MLLPGHIAAAVLCHRYLKLDLRLALVASLLPDAVDKFLYHVLHWVPSSRVPMHTLPAWLATTALVALCALGWSAISHQLSALRRASAFPLYLSSLARGLLLLKPSRSESVSGLRSLVPVPCSLFAGGCKLTAIGWFLAYGAHLLGDSPLFGGDLPILFPFRAYDFSSPAVPWSFLWGLGEWPLYTLVMEALLVAVTLFLELRRRAQSRRRQAYLRVLSDR